MISSIYGLLVAQRLIGPHVHPSNTLKPQHWPPEHTKIYKPMTTAQTEDLYRAPIHWCRVMD